MPAVDISNPAECGPLGSEWIALQHSHEAHERNAVWLKLVAIFAWASGLVIGAEPDLLAAVLILIWILEAQLHTFKARIATRLLRIEAALRAATHEAHAFQLHSEWLAGRPGTLGLLAEYGRCGSRPTVAFPYVVLLLACFASVFLH